MDLAKWVARRAPRRAASIPATSQRGGSQALEDVVAIAICLRKINGDKSQVPLAMHVYERIRYNRVARIDQPGVQNRENCQSAHYTKDDDFTVEKMKTSHAQMDVRA